MKKILVVEDDREISRMIYDYLSSQGYEVIAAYNGYDAVRIALEQRDISLLILDLMLPFQSGDMVLQKIRESSDTPVIVVSAKSETHTKIDLIRMGADDYLTKPFDLDELMVRIEAVLRRYVGNSSNIPENKILTYRNLELDVTAGTAKVCGKDLVLTGKEFAILELMMNNPVKLWSKANLFESVWGEDYLTDDSTIKVHMSKSFGMWFRRYLLLWADGLVISLEGATGFCMRFWLSWCLTISPASCALWRIRSFRLP